MWYLPWNQINSMYSITYMLKIVLVWLQDMAVAGKIFVPSWKSPLMDARPRPPQNLIRLLCGMKDINWVTLLAPMVRTWPHRHRECALTSISAIRITQVRVIFKLPSHLGLYLHPLAYIEWFTSLCRHNPISRQFIVTHSTHNHWCNVLVISVDRFMCACHLQAQCGRNISLDWSSDNVLEMVGAFHVNSYINLDTFVALAD